MTLMMAEPDRKDVGEQGPGPDDSPVDLAVGLQLLRASSLASVRLQLALARRDRRVAMAALDTLAAVDAEIEGLVDRLAEAGGATPELTAIAAWLAQEKAAVAADKLNLACDVSGPSLVSAPERLSEAADAGEAAAVDPATGEAGPDPVGASAEAEGYAPTRRWGVLLLLAIVIAVLTVGAVVALALLGGEQLPDIAEVSRLIGLR